jgi:ATP-dependent Zn protease
MQKDFEFETPDPKTDLDNTNAAETPAAFDCGDFIAELMIRSVVNNPAKQLVPGLYIFRVKDDEWCSEIKQALWNLYLASATGGRKRRMVDTGLPYLQIFQLLSTDDRREALHLVKKVQEALVVERTVAVIASALATVPSALESASDQIFTVPPPSSKSIRDLVRKIVPAARRVDLHGVTFEAVTPPILRLAYRRDISATVFVRRLRTLTAPALSRPRNKFIPLDRIHGVDEAKSWAMSLKVELEKYKKGELAWIDLTHGLLLAGPPGTAKTTLAGSIANFCGLNFVPTSYAEWQRANNGHLGDVLRAMASKFAEARTNAPSLIFIDELDTVGSRGEGGKRDDWWRSIINALLELIDGCNGNEGVIVVGASNHPNLIDPAILRSGRMEEHIVLGLPDSNCLSKIYRDELAAVLDNTVDLQRVALLSLGMTGADVVKTCTKARRRARNAARSVTFEDLLEGITGASEHVSHEIQFRTAVHEAGHAIAALAYSTLELGHVTIVGRGDEGGGTALRQKSGTATTAAAIDSYMAALLAGRAAEEVLLGEISAGSGGRQGSDLSRATSLAAKAELSLGMSDQKLIWYPPGSPEELARLFALRPDISQQVSERLDHAYSKAKEIISRQADLVLKLAAQLVTSKVMTSKEIVALVTEQSDEETLRITETDIRTAE